MRHRLTLLSTATALILAAGAGPAAASHNISTVAGNGSATLSGDGGPATSAGIGVPLGVTAVPDGGYLLAEQGIDSASRVFPDGTIRTIAGSGTTGYTGDKGPATQATMNGPSGVAMTADGGYLIADSNNNAIRRVAPDGTITTVVGGLGAGFGGDGGPATAAKLSFPSAVAVQPDGGYLISDNDNNRIRRVAPDGTISTVAGGGAAGLGDGGPATAATLNGPSSIAPTPDGGYLISEIDGQRIRKVAADGTITTVAGNGTRGFSGDGGPATGAMLNDPNAIAPTPDGGFLIADVHNQRIRRVAPDGTITTIAGNGTAGFTGDGGPPTGAELNNPFGLALTPGGDILIGDATNNRVRAIDGDPPAPTLTGTTPTSPANDNAPKILGTAAPGTTVTLFTNDTCTGAAAGAGTAADFAGPGIAVTVPDNSTTTFHAHTTDGSGNASPCSTSALTYVESTPALPPPVEGKTVNAVPVKGTVLVKLPKSASAKATAPVFVPLESIGRQLPVGSTLDTKRGTVKLTAAANARGATQHGNFSGGLFRFGQTRKNPLTTLTMTGGGLSACRIKLPPGGAAKRVKRRRSLFSSVKGHFRTRGRNSTATVRGTSWTMTDTCAGTLTSVKTGTVAVFDLRKHKTKLVRAGHSYLAHAAPLRKH